jgi:hypothetical protein
MERAAYFSAWREKKLHGVILVISSVMGNAATRNPAVTSERLAPYDMRPRAPTIVLVVSQ